MQGKVKLVGKIYRWCVYLNFKKSIYFENFKIHFFFSQFSK